uniref:Protein SHQ1 homolog n=1 Tax=Rhipicephalus appendiculatus TaxID=34631 RepID=A0A131YGR2_RHIAP
MLTPAFELRQDDDFLIIEIKAPYSKISEAEIYFHEEEFTFYSKPYYLRLHLPGKVVENGHETAKYISDNGVYVVHMPKQSPGQVFTGLDLLTKLLAPNPRAVRAQPVIEVLENWSASDEPPEVDWHVEQMPWTPQDEVSLLDGRKYGFDRQRTGVIARVKEEIPDLVDIADPEHKSVKEARQERLKAEEGHFSAEHYLADRYEPACVEQVLAYEPPWQNLCSEGSTDNLFCFTEEEKTKMRNLPRKEYLLDRQLVVSLELGLVDILFAYAYNKRVTEGEDTVESGWNISKLSATLSWFEEFWSLEQTVRSCFRRCLIYPLYRHWALAQAVLGDVIQILQLGPRYVLRCLLEIHSIFSRHDSRYVLNDLYITDYAVWIQSVSPRRLQSLADALKRVKVRKADLDLDIPELEQGAKLAIAEASVEEAATGMQALCISNPLASTGDAPSANNIIAEPQNRRTNDDDSTSSDSSSWSDDESDSSDSSSDSSSELDSDDDEVAAAGASHRIGAAPGSDSLSVTSNSDSDSDDGSSSEGVDLLLVKDAEPEKRR